MSLQIIKWPAFLEESSGQCAITIGVFDGVHLGHKALIEKIVKKGPNPTVITFTGNPKKLFPSPYEGDLYSLKQKLAVFESLGVMQAILIDFSHEFSKLKGWEFISLLQKTGKMAFLAIGDNFHCGFQQDTGAVFIKEMNDRRGIPTEIVPPVVESLAAGSGSVSSSRIRSLVISGDLKLAAELMGRNFSLDLSDIVPLQSKTGSKANRPAERKKREVYLYDIRSVNRVAPADGHYSVLMYPGCIKNSVDVKGGKVYLSDKAESLEFI